MGKRHTLTLAGESGMGIDSSGEIISHALAKLGLWVTSDREYPSLIKGGLSNFNLNFWPKRLRGLTTTYQVGVWLGKEGVQYCLEHIEVGGYLLHNFERRKEWVPDLLVQAEKKKITVLYIPSREICDRHKVGYLFENTIVIGAIAKLYGIPYEIIEHALHTRYGKKEKIREMNKTCLREGYETGTQSNILLELPATLPGERVIIDGNSALALGAIHAGVRAYFAYPMSPSSSLLDYFAATAQETGIVVKQAEDEITAIQMNIGASYAGTRALTATSGWWFDLMSESVSLSGMIEVPCVVVVGQRPGPATWLPTRTAQGDLNLALYAGHGEFPRLVVAVSDQQSAFEIIQHAFNYAEQYQLPCVVLTEKAIAENHATIPLFETNTTEIQRWLITDQNELKQLVSADRYRITENGVSKRRLPTSCPIPYFCNGDEHTEDGSLDETPAVADMASKRLRKLVALRDVLPEPVIYWNPDATIGLIWWWGTKMAMLDAIELLEAQWITISYLHIEWIRPLKKQPIISFLSDKSKFAVIENNATGQLAQLIQQETGITIDKRYLKRDGRAIFVDDVVNYVKSIFNT